MTISGTEKPGNTQVEPVLYKLYTSPEGEQIYGTSPPDQSKLVASLSEKLAREVDGSLKTKSVTILGNHDVDTLPVVEALKQDAFNTPIYYETQHLTSSSTVELNVTKAEKFFRDVVLKDEHLLKLFMEKFPKTDLHLHIDGSIHSRQLLNMAVVKNLYCKVMDTHFEFGTQDELTATDDQEKDEHSVKGLSGRIISARELQQDNTLREKFYEIVSMRGAKGGGYSGHHKHFFQAFNTLESIAKYIHLKDKLTLLLRNTNDHVRYLEPSIWFEKEPIPKDFETRFDEIFSDSGLTSETVEALLEEPTLKEWVNRYVEKAQKILDECNEVTDDRLIEKGFSRTNLFDLRNPHVVRFIIDNDRTVTSLATVFAHFVGSMTLEKLDERVVGSGFAGEEYDDNAINHYDDHMAIISALKKHFYGAKLSLHAGELNRQLSQTEEPLKTNVRKAVMAGADRIGHAVSITDDPDWLGLFEEMKRRDVHVECCIKSNQNVLGVTNGTHPIPWFIFKGVSFSLCTDDQGVNNSSPASEMFLAAQRYNTNKDHKVKEGRNLGYQQLKRSVINSIRKSFLPGKSIYKKPGSDGKLVFKENFQSNCLAISGLREIISSCIDPTTGKWSRDVFSLLTSDQKLFISNSPKAQMQLEIEKEFIYFEQVVVPDLEDSL